MSGAALPPRSSMGVQALTGFLCLASGQLAHVLVGTDLAPVIIWPPAGIALGAALVWGMRVIPAAFVGTLAATVPWHLPWTSGFLLALAVAVQAAVGTWLLRRAGFPMLLPRVVELLKLFMLGGVVTGALAASLTFFALRDVDWFWETTFLRCALGVFLAHLLSTLVFSPLIICRPTATCPKPLGTRAEALGVLSILLLAAVAMAHPTFLGLPQGVFRPYPLMPFLLWLAMRSTPRHTALGIALIYGVAASTQGWGQGHLFNLLPDTVVLPIHGFILVMGLSFMVLAVLMVSRSLAERALRESEARLRNVVGLIRNCLWETDAQGRFVHVDSHADSVFGLPAQAMLGRRPEDIWPEGLGPALRGQFGRTLEMREAECEAQTYRKADGDLAYLETNCAALRDEKGQHLGWQGISREVSDRVHMARDLDETHRRFRQLAENIQEVFWISVPLTRFLYISPKCEEVFGLPAERLYQDYMAWNNLVHEDDRPKLVEALRSVTRREVVNIEFRILHPRKGLRWMWGRTFPFEEEGGDPMNAGIIEDITDRKQAEQDHINQLETQRDTLVREVHHRIKNNLQTVVGLLRREAGKHPEAKAAIEQAITQVQSVAVVHGLHGRVTQHTIMLCELLPAIVNNVSDLTGVPVLLRGMREGCGELRIKDNETVAIALILNELVTNAVKHAGQGADESGPLVTMAREGHIARIRIVNPGRLPAGFDFAEGRGLGTGLSLVKALMPAPGMRIDIRQVDGRVEMEMLVEGPVLTPVAMDQLEFGKSAYEKNSDR